MNDNFQTQLDLIFESAKAFSAFNILSSSKEKDKLKQYQKSKSPKGYELVYNSLKNKGITLHDEDGKQLTLDEFKTRPELAYIKVPNKSTKQELLDYSSGTQQKEKIKIKK